MGKCRKLKLGRFEIIFQEEVPSNFVRISGANNLQCNSAMADFENRNIFSARRDLIEVVRVRRRRRRGLVL